MDRTCIVALAFGLVSLTHPVVAQTTDSDLPYQVAAIQCRLSAVQDAVDYCKSLGFKTVDGIVAEIVEDPDLLNSFDLTKPIRYGFCIDSKTSAMLPVVSVFATRSQIEKQIESPLIPVPDHDNLFRIGSDDNQEVGFVQVEHGWATLVILDDDTGILTVELAEKLIHRHKLQQSRNSKYQWSISSSPSNIKPPIFKAMLKQFIAATSVHLQKRDGENEIDYQLRSLLGRTAIEAVESFFENCELIEIGFKVLPDEERGTVDIVLKAVENSTLDRWMTKTAQARSPFSGILQEDNRNAAAISLVLNETQKAGLKSLASAIRKALVESRFAQSSAEHFVKAVDDQLKRGQVHGFLQIEKLDPAKPFDSISGGIGLKNSEAIVPAVTQLITLAARTNPGILVDASHDGSPPIHYWNNPFGNGDQSTMAVCATSNGIWFAIGHNSVITGHRVNVPDADGNTEVEKRIRPIEADSTDARKLLENLLADVRQSRKSRERSFLLRTSMSTRFLTLESQFKNMTEDTTTHTYAVQIPNEDGTMRTETRTRTVKVAKRSTSTVAGDDESAPEPGAKVKRASATEETPPEVDGPNRIGRIRFHTEAIKNGLRLHGEFEKDGILQLLIFPELLIGAVSLAFEAVGGE